MNLLLDTHVVIWFITDDKKLPRQLDEQIKNENNKCFVSVASLWELGVKYSLNRLDIKSSLREIFQIIENSGFDILPVIPEHIITNSTLYFHHRDPFDRIIIAQGIEEGIAILTKDIKFSLYEVNTVWDDSDTSAVAEPKAHYRKKRRKSVYAG